MKALSWVIIREIMARLENMLNSIEKIYVLSGRDDAKSAYLEIHAGSGGLGRRTGPRCCFGCI